MDERVGVLEILESLGVATNRPQAEEETTLLQPKMESKEEMKVSDAAGEATAYCCFFSRSTGLQVAYILMISVLVEF